MYTSSEIGSHNPLMPIDTLAISKRLQVSGMPKKQAEAQAEVFGEIITQNLASKTDVESLRKDTKTDIENLRKDLIIEIGKIKFDIMKWIIPLMAGQLAATAGLFKMFSN